MLLHYFTEKLKRNLTWTSEGVLFIWLRRLLYEALGSTMTRAYACVLFVEEDFYCRGLGSALVSSSLNSTFLLLPF